MFKVYDHNIVLNNKGGNRKVTLVISENPFAFFACPEDWCICFNAETDTILSLPISKEPVIGERLYIICDTDQRIAFGGTRHEKTAEEIARNIRQGTRYNPIVVSSVFEQRV